MRNYKNTFSSAFLYLFFLDSKAARNSKSEEKHSLSLFTVFHVPNMQAIHIKG